MGEAEEDDGPRNKFACWIALIRTHYAVSFVFVLIVYWPRLVLSVIVFVIAQLLRLLARVIPGLEVGKPVNNRRILMITDYLPPQTHGIAIRCQAYAKYLRANGDYVCVFATAYDASKETCWDHPNIPSIRNPFNPIKNRIGYSPGVKLAWFLGIHTWDVVHIVYPSLIGGFVIACCNWRRIPTYCSHHVEMDMFSKHAPWPLDKVGLFLYELITKQPAVLWGTLNSAPTLCFAKAHCGTRHEDRLRCVPSGTHDCFTRKQVTEDERSRVRRDKFGIEDEETKVCLMVQRLSKEKGTERAFPAFQPQEDGGPPIVKGVLALAGDGPSKRFLEEQASYLNINVIFLGNVPHHELPELYRAADCFVTMSLSETYGLTCLEAQMCGCPAVMPYCEVFDEIWGKRVPVSWRYTIDSSTLTPKAEELASAISAAQNGRKYLEEHPVDQTWKNAALLLREQYEECIELNKPAKEQGKRISFFLAFWIRVIIVVGLVYLISAKYYNAIRQFGIALQSRGLFSLM